MEEIIIERYNDYENGSKFDFKYVGIPYTIYDDRKVNNLIDSFLNKEVLHSDMPRNIAYLRTILSTSKEKKLIVEYKDINNEEIVEYKDGFLISYECKKYDNESLNYVEVKFTPKDELKVSFSDLEDKNIIINVKDTKVLFDKIIDHISSLSNVNPIFLNNDTKAIIKTYKIFYNENPNFKKEDINIKIQTMLSILAQFDICFGNYSFSLNEQMPESLEILQIVNRLFPLGEIVVVEDPVELKPRAKEIIKIVGESIRERIANDMDINEVLIAISKTIYASQYSMVSMYDIQKLIEYPNLNLTYDEIKTSAHLVKTIKERITKSNIS